MPEFDYSFMVEAPVERVSAFHRDTRVLKKLTPPPIFAQIHAFEPLGEGSRASFTLWFGPLPVRWEAVHSDVGPHGFTDTQVKGPLASWQHTHRFSATGPSRTRVDERIVYQHAGGVRGLISRLLFARPALYLLFTARKYLTRRGVSRLSAAGGAGRVGRPT